MIVNLWLLKSQTLFRVLKTWASHLHLTAGHWSRVVMADLFLSLWVLYLLELVNYILFGNLCWRPVVVWLMFDSTNWLNCGENISSWVTYILWQPIQPKCSTVFWWFLHVCVSVCDYTGRRIHCAHSHMNAASSPAICLHTLFVPFFQLSDWAASSAWWMCKCRSSIQWD